MAEKQGQTQALDIDRYISLLFRRKWAIILGMIPFLLAGMLYCLFAVKVYRTTTTIIIVPQRVPEAYVRSTVTGDVGERIRGIWQEITSRTNLEKIIQQFNLYPGAREALPMETVVGMMREKIQIDSPRAARTNAFVLSFEGKDPVLITRVMNSLANMFIEENLKLREAQARGTAEFLSNELDKVYADLLQREEALKQYKTEHMGELPEQIQTNLSMLQRSQEELETLQENIRRAEDRKLLLQRQLAEEQSNVRTGALTVSGSAREQAAATPTSLEGLMERLKALKTRYTDIHPDVVAIKKLIAKMQREQGSRSPTSDGEETRGESEEERTPFDTGAIENAITVGLRYQLKSLDLEMNAMRKDSEKVKDRMDMYQERIEGSPKREQELVDLTRDYNNLRSTYESLLTRKIEAEQSAALERRQKGEQFRVIDPARIPETYFKPQLKKLLAMTLLLAAGAGLGLALGLEYLGKALYDPGDVTKALDVEVIASIPLVLTFSEKWRQRRNMFFLSSLAGIGYAAAGALLLVLWIKGPGFLAGIF